MVGSVHAKFEVRIVVSIVDPANRVIIPEGIPELLGNDEQRNRNVLPTRQIRWHVITGLGGQITYVIVVFELLELPFVWRENGCIDECLHEFVLEHAA